MVYWRRNSGWIGRAVLPTVPLACPVPGHWLRHDGRIWHARFWLFADVRRNGVWHVLHVADPARSARVDRAGDCRAGQIPENAPNAISIFTTHPPAFGGIFLF